MDAGGSGAAPRPLVAPASARTTENQTDTINRNAFLAGLQTGAQIGGSIRDRKQRQKEREEDLAIASELRNWQKSRDDRDFNYRKGRDAITDQHVADDMAFRQRQAETSASQFNTTQDRLKQQEIDAQARWNQSRLDQLDENKMARELRNREIEARIQMMRSPARSGAFRTVQRFGDDGETITERYPIGEEAPATPPPTTPATQAQQAIDWARANPNDPRAKAILQRLGVR